jgi:GntR family transcriptional regulator
MLERLVLHDNGIPIYVQLRDQLAALIGRGLLKPGERLPTMREIAVALRIDLNTVQRACGELERDGLLTLVRGRGTFVAETPPAPRNARKQTQDFAARIAAQARGQGIDLGELAQALAKLAERAS